MTRAADPDDVRRCQGTACGEQCPNVAEHGSTHCARHGGRSTLNREKTRLYQLNRADLRLKLAEKSDHEDAKSLREELAIARTLLEARINSAQQSDAHLLAESAPINTLLLTIERLQKSNHSIETDVGMMLARQSILKIARGIADILADRLKQVADFENLIDDVMNDVVHLIMSTTNDPVEKPVDRAAPKLLPGPP